VINELCPYCGAEVELEAKFKKQRCPDCNEKIKPCSLCDMDQVECKKCELDLGTQIEELIKSTLDESVKKHGERFTDDHHAYAVIKEEIEELEEQFEFIKLYLEIFWKNTKKDIESQEIINTVKEKTILLIAEALQVAAMCMKYKNSKAEEKKLRMTCKDGICSMNWGEEQ